MIRADLLDPAIAAVDLWLGRAIAALEEDGDKAEFNACMGRALAAMDTITAIIIDPTAPISVH